MRIVLDGGGNLVVIGEESFAHLEIVRIMVVPPAFRLRLGIIQQRPGGFSKELRTVDMRSDFAMTDPASEIEEINRILANT